MLERFSTLTNGIEELLSHNWQSTTAFSCRDPDCYGENIARILTVRRCLHGRTKLRMD